MPSYMNTDEVLEINRKLLKVLGKRLNIEDPAEEFAANEFFYRSTFVFPDELIRTDTDSAFIACGVMFPNYVSAVSTLTSSPDPGSLFLIEQLSAGRLLMQANTDDGSPVFGLPATYIDPMFMTDNDPSNPYDCTNQFWLKEPFLIPPGSALRCTFISGRENLSAGTYNYTRTGVDSINRWILIGYKVKLV